MLAGSPISAHERALVDLAHWLARTVQYSADHPACRRLAEKAHASLGDALAQQSPLVVGVLKDDVLVGGVSTRHPAIRARIGACLHERGALVLRFIHGVTRAELGGLVELLTLPVQTVFDRGGLLRLAMNAGFARIQIEELAHDVTAEERESQRRRAKLRSFFKEVLLELLAKHVVDARVAAHLVELLEHPDIAVTLLEEDPAGLAEAAAGLALMVRQEEARTGVPLGANLRAVLLGLAPRSRDRLLLGFPALVDEFRGALVWSFDGFSEAELARLAAPAVRARPGELDTVLYALSAAVPHEGTRLSALRLLGLSFFDLPADEPSAAEALTTLAQPVPEYDSFHAEREVLRALAAEALAARAALRALPRPPSNPPRREEHHPPFDGRRALGEVIAMATHTRSFDRFCQMLPAAVDAMLADGSSLAVVGVLRGLAGVAAPEWRGAVTEALKSVASSSAATVLVELDAAIAGAEGEPVEEAGAVVRLLATLAPASVLEHLDASDNRRMRRIALDALSSAGAPLLPLVTPRLRSPRWFVARNAVLLLARVGGTARDLAALRGHPEPRVRMEIMRALRVMPQDAASTEMLVSYLADEVEEVRQQARSMLRGELLGDDGIAELERLVTDDQRPEDLRCNLVDALGRSPRDAAAGALYRVLHPQGFIESAATAAVRDRAAFALRRSAAAAAAGYFQQGLASPVRRVRKACERAAEGGGAAT